MGDGMRYGIVFKNRWNDNPLTVFKTNDTDSYADLEPIDPSSVDAGWSKASVTKVRALTAFNLQTRRTRHAYVVSRP